jgi:hypothetical protein
MPASSRCALQNAHSGEETTAKNKGIQINEVEVFLKLRDEKASESAVTYTKAYAAGPPLKASLSPAAGEPSEGELKSVAGFLEGMPYSNFVFDTGLLIPTKLSFEVKEDEVKNIAPALRLKISVAGTEHTRLKPEAIDDILFLAHYSVP